MKRLISSVALSIALGTSGCAHQQLTNEQLARKTVKVVGIVGLIALMAMGVQRGGVQQ